MELSVIISAYKFKEYIVQCVDSILSQRADFDFEVIIRDDGSNDGTIELLREKYGSISNVKILDSSTNVGAVENLIILMDAANGKYIAHLDGDDYLTDVNYYQRAVDFLNKKQEYAMYSSGCRYFKDEVFPKDHWIVSAKPYFELKDLLVENYVSFARVFKKTKISKDIFNKILYPDWAFNFEVLKLGKGFCDVNSCVGIYRIHSNGMFSMTSEEEKLKNKKIMQEELSKRYQNLQPKVITIVDSFLHNDNIRKKLSKAVNWMQEDGHEVLLVSNTIVNEDILKNVKFYLYDSRNQLFEKKYNNVDFVDFWKNLSETMDVHDLTYGVQKHGLSVLINLFNSLLYAKRQGYTHFQRFEVDDLFGKKSREYVKKIPNFCATNCKKGLFYFNNENSPPDVSFHYFFCEIDYFLNKIPQIFSEDDYINYINKRYKNQDFKIVEVILYDNLEKDNEIIKKSGKEMNFDFSDTNWNTETSFSNFNGSYGGCTTKIYNVKKLNPVSGLLELKKEYLLFTYSYVDVSRTRTIEVEKLDGEKYRLEHSVTSAGGWVWNSLPVNTKSISVYEKDVCVYTQNTSEQIESYIVFR